MTEDKNQLPERVTLVNGLLQKVFGRTARGNLMDFDSYPLPEQSELYLIARGIGLPVFYKIIGQFTKNDGSEVKVLPKFEENMRKYASLFEKQFGSKVNVIVCTDATHTPQISY